MITIMRTSKLDKLIEAYERLDERVKELEKANKMLITSDLFFHGLSKNFAKDNSISLKQVVKLLLDHLKLDIYSTAPKPETYELRKIKQK